MQNSDESDADDEGEDEQNEKQLSQNHDQKSDEKTGNNLEEISKALKPEDDDHGYTR